MGPRGRDERPNRLVFRTATNVLRSRGAPRRAEPATVVRMTPPRDELAEAESRADVVAVLSVLTPRQRAAIVLLDLDGLSSEQAAKALGVRPSTVRVQAARAREALKKGLSRVD
jgi:RNA polymerase sigma factor (sigma-70 family)